MGLFGLFSKKVDTAKSDANKAVMRRLFDQVVPEGGQYKLVYGFSQDITKSSYIIARKTTYTYTSLIIGYRTDDPTVVILQTDPTLSGCSDPVTYRRSDIHKAYRSRMTGDSLVIYPDTKGYFQFYTYPLTDDESLYVYMDQEQEDKEFTEFFLKVFATK